MKKLSLAGVLLSTSLLFSSITFADSRPNLRAGVPSGTFETSYGTTELNSAKVEVRNDGSSEAKDVVVRVVVPDGRSGELFGPKSLAPGQKAIYSSDAVYLHITKGGKLKAEAGCSNCGGSASGASPDKGASGQLTTLRSKTPLGVFDNIGGTTYLVDASVEVRNAGSVAAQGVRVQVETPGGGMSALHGPASIAPNQSQVYRSRLFEAIASSKQLRANVSCDNCRK